MGKHLDFYITCIERGKMPTDGLCAAVTTRRIDMETFDLFIPTDDDFQQLNKEGKCTSYWAGDLPDFDVSPETFTGFTPLRQTIVLFMAAINGEL